MKQYLKLLETEFVVMESDVDTILSNGHKRLAGKLDSQLAGLVGGTARLMGLDFVFNQKVVLYQDGSASMISPTVVDQLLTDSVQIEVDKDLRDIRYELELVFNRSQSWPEYDAFKASLISANDVR